MNNIDEISRRFLRLVLEESERRGGDEFQTYSRNKLINLFRKNFSSADQFSMVMDSLFFHDLMDAEIKQLGNYEFYYITEIGNIFLNEPISLEFDRAVELSALQIKINSTDWTGLARGVNSDNLRRIRFQSDALLSAIMQSDADIQTRTDACKRVEAVILLLDSPNVPWREIVSLLNHPTVTAFFAAISLLQFIVGISS